MQRVDLTLAVNYLPACTCLGKLLVFMLAISFIPSEGVAPNAYLLLAAVLYMDRMITRNIIFDANAILLAVFFANVHAAIRAHGTMRTYPVLMGGLHICWVNTCALLIAEPVSVREILQRRLTMSRVVPVAMLLVIIVGTSYFQEDLEPSPIRACRAIAFTLLTFAWIYVVGIHSQHGLEYLKENSCQFVARLAPVLYSPIWIAFLFCPAVVWGLVIQNLRRNSTFPFSATDHHESTAGGGSVGPFNSRSTSASYQLLPTSSSTTNMNELPPASLSMAAPNASSLSGSLSSTAESHGSNSASQIPSQDSDLEQLFRLAKQAHKSRPPLDTIMEAV
jgi:hypothetical protein